MERKRGSEKERARTIQEKLFNDSFAVDDSIAMIFRIMGDWRRLRFLISNCILLNST